MAIKRSFLSKPIDQHPSMTSLYRFVAILLCLNLSPAYADKLDDNLQTVWESLWDQRGTPRRVMRWEGTVTYRIHGSDAPRHRAHIENGVKAASVASQIVFADISAQTDAETAANLDVEVVDDHMLQDSEPCFTQNVKTSKWIFEKVKVKMRSREAWRCTFHEMMHVMGVAGHPSGKTVLSYFPYRRDALMDLDQLMLGAWYSPAMSKGATPLEAMVVLSNAVAAQADLGLPAEEAQRRAKAFNQSVLAQMESLALGQGAIPNIVLRSGKSSQTFIDNAKRAASYMVGLAYLRGTIADKNAATSSIWFKRSALKGYDPGQVMWARALRGGLGIEPDKMAAHTWFTEAAKAGNSAATADLATLEKTMTADELDKARSQTPPALDPS